MIPDSRLKTTVPSAEPTGTRYFNSNNTGTISTVDSTGTPEFIVVVAGRYSCEFLRAGTTVITIKLPEVNEAMRDAIDDLWQSIKEHPVDLVKLTKWCEKLEVYWSVEQTVYDEGTCETKTAQEPLLLQERLEQVSDRTLQLMIHAMLGGSISDEIGDQFESHDDVIKQVVDQLSSAPKPSDYAIMMLRVSKNLLRWYLQVYRTAINSSAKNDPIPIWKSLQLLRLFVTLIGHYCQSDLIAAQHASQLLFYASYNPVSGSDSTLQESYQHLLEEELIINRLLQYLVAASSDVPLILSLIRNMHNIVVSFPRGSHHVNQATCDYHCESRHTSSWLPTEDQPITFRNALPLIALWAIKESPPFPGERNSDKRAELVLEIQRVAYTLRMGNELSPGSPVMDMILTVLKLENCDECRHATIPMLMDASQAVVNYLYEKDVVPCLFSVLDSQVNYVVGKQIFNESGAAQLTPIFVVLHRCCSISSQIRELTKNFVFPPGYEEEFQSAFRKASDQGRPMRNMHPLVSVPRDSLRGRLILLLTWPQSHIKRFAGELLWVLCNSNHQEFVARVGMGNGVMILSSRGLFRVPGQS